MAKKNHYNKRRNIFLLGIIVLFSLAIRLVFFSGIDASDGLHNTKYAYDISKNIFPTDKNQANSRIGLLVPVSILYSKFGINDVASTIFVLFTSIAGIILIYFFGKFLFDEKTGLLAALLLSFFPLDVIYSTKLLSDLPSAFFAALSIFFFLKGEQLKNKKAYVLYMLSGLSLGIAFAIREMAILVILFFIAYALYNRKLKTSYAIAVAGFLIVLAFEMGFFYAHTGSPFYRFNSLNVNYLENVINDKFYGRLSFPKFFIAWPYVIFGNIQLGYFYAFISLALFYFLFTRKRATNYLVIWFLSILLYLNFGTSSIARYAPFLAVARYLSFVTMPGILLLAAFLMEKKDVIRKSMMPFILIFLFFTSIGGIYLDESRHGLDGLRETYSYIKSFNKPIYTDARSKFAMEYISGYNSNLNLIDLEVYTKDLADIKDAYVILNNRMVKSLKAAGENLKFTKQIGEASKNWVKVKETGKDSDENIVIYYAR